MKLVDRFKNTFLLNNKYKTNSEAVIIACYFNPQRNPYRLSAFKTWYDSIKHLNHRIVECVIDGSQPELGFFKVGDENYSRIYTPNLLWHKEALLNNIVSKLPAEYKYVFWLDTDVIFTNQNWLVDAVNVLEHHNLVQPFEFCVHLDQDQREPNFNLRLEKSLASVPQKRHPKLWRSFSSNHVLGISSDQNYDKHGHVGFAWGARREILDAVPLYDKALVGGADHIIAHAGAGHIGHSCITKSFTEDIDAVNEWSKKFYSVVRGKIGYVPGDLYHIWHGDIEKRQYLKRVQEFTPEAKKITKKDKNGLYVTDNDTYVKQYFNEREVKPVNTQKLKETLTKAIAKDKSKKITANRNNTSKHVYYEKRAELQNMYPDRDDSFIDSMIWGYITDSTVMGSVMGGNMMGAMVGDMLNHNDDPQHIDLPASESFNSSNIQSDSTNVDTTDYTTSDNFS